MLPPKNINLRQQKRRIDSEAKLVHYIRTNLGEPLITVDCTEGQILQCIDDTFQKFADWKFEPQQNMLLVIEAIPGVSDYVLDDRVKAIYGCSLSTGQVSGGGMWGGLPMSSMMPPNYVPATDSQGNSSHLESYGGGGGLGSATGVAGGVTGPHSGAGSAGSSNPLEAAWASMANAQTMQYMFGTAVNFDYNSSNKNLRLFEGVSGPIAIECAMENIPDPLFDIAYSDPWIKAYSLNLVKRLWGNNTGKYDSPLVGGATLNYGRLIDEAQNEIDKLDEQLVVRSEALGIFSG